MKEENMNNSGSQAGKTDTVGHSKEGADIERTFPFISFSIKEEIVVYDSRYVIVLAGRRE